MGQQTPGTTADVAEGRIVLVLDEASSLSEKAGEEVTVVCGDDADKGNDTTPRLEEEDKSACAWGKQCRQRNSRDALLARVDWALLPLICSLYIFFYMDRVNITNARIIGIESGVDSMERDLQLGPAGYRWAVSVFFISYTVFDIPSNLLLRKLSPSVWLGSLAIACGALSIGTAFVKNFVSLVALRFTLGIVQAGFVPGVFYVFSVWYCNNELALRTAIFYNSVSIGGILGGLIAYGADKIGERVLDDWRWLFLIEGIPPVLLGVATFFFLPNYPKTATFLSEKERETLVSKLEKEHNYLSPDSSFDRKEFIETLLDWQTWSYSMLYFCFAINFYGINLCLPTIITSLGYSSVKAQLMTCPPYLVALLISVCLTTLSDRKRHRYWFLVGPALFSFFCLLILAFLNHQGFRYAFLCLLYASNSCAVPVLVSWCSSNVMGATRKGTALAILIFLGHSSGIIGPHIFTRDQPLTRGFLILAGVIAVAILIATSISMAHRILNRKRKELLASLGQDAFDVTPLQTDKDQRFVYQL